jgi:hypothetical protein
MGGVRRKAGATSVPAKVVEFVAGVRHVHLPNQLAVVGGRRINIHHLIASDGPRAVDSTAPRMPAFLEALDSLVLLKDKK